MIEGLVSVVLPVFNGAKYIGSALSSILKQGPGVEIIVSDDASSDNTLDVVRQLDAPNIKIITSESRGGQFVNLNRGIRASCGEYIQFFSHDDIALEGFLDSQVKSFRDDDSIGLVYASYRSIDQNGGHLGLCDDDGTPDVIDFPTYLSISSRHGSLPGSISSVMVRRSCLTNVGLFDHMFKVAGDLEFYNRVAEKFKLARNRQLQLLIRSHPGSVTLNPSTPILFAQEEIEILKFYKKHLGDQAYLDMIRTRSERRGADHAKYIFRALARGQMMNAIAMYRALSLVHSVPQCMCHALSQKVINASRLVFSL